jgi:hypothetical protein
MKTTATNKRIRELLSNLRDEKLEPRPDFQRRLVWSNKDKCKFIETVLLGYPFPEIYLAAGEVDVDTGEAKELLVDGQQRITTLYQYFINSNELKLPPKINKYNDLSDGEKEAFLQYEVVVRDLGKVDLELIREVFLRINETRYSLNAMEINNARYEGEYKDFAEKIAQKPFFDIHRVFSSTEIRRMQDTRYALSIVTTILSTYSNRDSELEEYLMHYNDNFSNKREIEREVDSVLNYIDALNFSTNSRVWKKSDLFTLIIELHGVLCKRHLTLSTKEVSNLLTQFYNSVDKYEGGRIKNKNVIKYHKSAIQATNDRNNRIARGEVIRELLLSSLM